jgi:hypothetical protein
MMGLEKELKEAAASLERYCDVLIPGAVCCVACIHAVCLVCPSIHQVLRWRNFLGKSYLPRYYLLGSSFRATPQEAPFLESSIM